jgi:hypothetical protein
VGEALALNKKLVVGLKGRGKEYKKLCLDVI